MKNVFVATLDKPTHNKGNSGWWAEVTCSFI